VEVKLNPLGLAGQDLLVGGANGVTAVLPLNLPLLRRVVLDPGDVESATLVLSCKRSDRRIDVVARGTGRDGESANLRALAPLAAIRMRAGQELAITVWKSDWHYNGGAMLSGLRIVRLGAGGALPVVFPEGKAQTERGTFSLAGLSSRDKFPVIANRCGVKAGAKAGDFEVPEGAGANLGVRENGLSFHTNGRANSEARYGRVPALVFVPSADGTYAVEGELKFRCARPGGNISWIIGRLKLAGGPTKGTTVALHRLLREPGAEPVAGADYDKEPLAVIPLKGDGSALDRYDRMLADMAKNDIFVMFATTVGQGMPMKPLLEDDSWIAGGDDWPEWKAAVKEAGAPPIHWPTLTSGCGRFG
jgi:hypothetical protein